MLIHRWKKPVIIENDGLRFTIGSAEEAITWLDHQPKKASPKWRIAWEACRAVIDKGLNADKARSAVVLAAKK